MAQEETNTDWIKIYLPKLETLKFAKINMNEIVFLQSNNKHLTKYDVDSKLAIYGQNI